MQTYRIYATRQGASSKPDYAVLVPYEFAALNHAARCCVDLYRKGYLVHKVILPSGREIQREELQRVIMLGVPSTTSTFRSDDAPSKH